MDRIVKFKHHGKLVSSRKELVGKHREHCLCWICGKFNPENPEKNCKIANLLYRVDIICEITTPIFYCKEFQKK